MIVARLLLLLTGFALGSVAAAEQQVKSGKLRASVVELYTSEGCSSCPPADEFLSRLGQTREAAQIVPLAFHVDYWDYIGWKDRFASPLYTQRQRNIARANGQATIYTPEFVVDGVEARGSRKIDDQVTATLSSPAEADMVLSLSGIVGDRLTATVSVENIHYDGAEPAELFVAVYESGLHSSVNAGENTGRTLKHDYVVRYLSPARLTRSGQQHRFDLQLGAEWNHATLGVAAFVKLQGSGHTLQAVKVVL